jgi:glycosyltransferase involved in cell wall biosynthesis
MPPTPTDLRADELEVSIVMPCLNEAETLATCVDQARAALEQNGLRGEVIVADNGSTDGSQEIAAAHGASVVTVRRKGYGCALQGGIAAARGRYVLMGDADDSYDFGHAPRFVEKLRAGFDLVMGNRFAGGILPGAMPWKNRHVGNPILSSLGQLLFRCPSKDFHCGLRGFSKAAYERMQLQTTGMEFASEMVIKATLLEMRITEVPTTLKKDGRSRPPHLRPWRDGWRHLRFMLLYSPRWLFLFPGFILFVLGLAGMIALAARPWTVGHVTFDVHTLVYAMLAMLLGFQGVSFAVMSKIYATQSGLLPPNPVMTRLFRFVTLETGLLVGGAVFAAGLGLSIYAVWRWGQVDFGSLDHSGMLRLVIPGAGFMALGVQAMLLSFFLSILGLPIASAPVAGDPES